MASKWLILQPGINGAADCTSPISSSSSSFLAPLSFPPCQRTSGQIAPSTEVMTVLHGSLGEWAGCTIRDGQWNHLLGSEHEPEGWGIAPARHRPALPPVPPPTLPTLPHLPCLLQTGHFQPARMPAAAFLLIYVSILQSLPSEIVLKVSSVLHHLQAVMILSGCSRSG